MMDDAERKKCPVCQEEMNSSYHCILCKKEVHVICGRGVSPEGHGQKVICKKCEPAIVSTNDNEMPKEVLNEKDDKDESDLNTPHRDLDANRPENIDKQVTKSNLINSDTDKLENNLVKNKQSTANNNKTIRTKRKLVEDEDDKNSNNSTNKRQQRATSTKKHCLIKECDSQLKSKVQAPIPKDCSKDTCRHLIENGLHFNRSDLTLR